MAIRIRYVEGEVSVQARLERLRHLDATARKIIPQSLGIRRLEGDVREAVFRRALELRKDFDVLMVINLEISEQQTSRRVVHRKRFVKSKYAVIKLAGNLQIVRPKSDVSDADNRRTFDRSGGSRGAGRAAGDDRTGE